MPAVQAKSAYDQREVLGGHLKIPTPKPKALRPKGADRFACKLQRLFGGRLTGGRRGLHGESLSRSR
jgi:hypothetical protein